LIRSSDDFASHIRPVIQILTTSKQTISNNEVQARLIQVPFLPGSDQVDPGKFFTRFRPGWSR
jgi:hypothetical protein